MGIAAILINGPRPFEQMFNPPLTEGSTWILKKIGQGFQRRSFKSVDGQTDDGRTDGRRTASDHNSLSWAFGLFVCFEVLRPSQPNGVMSSAVSLRLLGKLSPLSG